jgi:hypothetical protein
MVMSLFNNKLLISRDLGGGFIFKIPISFFFSGLLFFKEIEALRNDEHHICGSLFINLGSLLLDSRSVRVQLGSVGID